MNKQREEFMKDAQLVRDIIASWPAWKRNLLGGWKWSYPEEKHLTKSVLIEKSEE